MFGSRRTGPRMEHERAGLASLHMAQGSRCENSSHLRKDALPQTNPMEPEVLDPVEGKPFFRIPTQWIWGFMWTCAEE